MEKNRTVNGQTTIIMITVSSLERLGTPSNFKGYTQNSIGYTQNITIFYPRKHRFCDTKSKQELSLPAVQELPPLTPQNIINQHKIR